MNYLQYIGLYIHVPFCRARCGYCSFASNVYQTPAASKYLAEVKREAFLASSSPSSMIETVYFGGGTPGVLSEGEIVKLAGSVFDKFRIKKDAEITFEANPESTTPGKLKLLRQLGINRLSIGVQSFHDDILEYLGRSHSRKDAVNAIESAKSAGFDNVSIDLIYGVPGQTSAMWCRDIETALNLGPEHISIYCLSLEPGVPLYRELKPDWADEELQADMYYEARNTFSDSGFNQYEISNFARPGFECRHNLKYWRDEEYLGLGISAAFHWAGDRYRNPDDLSEYASLIQKGKWPLVVPEPSNPEREMRTAVVLGLRLIEGIDLSAYKKGYGANLADYYGDILERLLEGGQLVIDGSNLRLAPQALFISDEVFSQLI